ncbi:acetoin dehydrogenase dihydrolipoyllysine-residue acetyltransferase subunit [Paraburkholderia sp. C35]|uniref:acetoin dehydrogenase dihydrolipoyllysine-residue acetyltransferase subunit n=1 Tax=Paraburkholderia sp. C35 TaxID=2126993 RepID=UPI000D69F8F7|nr:acetoin dehydrogenase dihydrolipoyllysine-residue acetyltransferase subunit [Paraburkholderia sp. C35]
MPTEVILPRVDMDMTEGSITAWYAKEGDTVKQGDPLFDIETSKATMEIEAPASGVVRRISAAAGDTVPVGTVIGWIYAAGEAVQDAPDAPLAARAEQATGVPTAAVTPLSRSNNAERSAPARLRATPAARRVAREHHVRLDQIGGTGPLGRIVEHDVQSFLQSLTAQRASAASASAAALACAAVAVAPSPSAPLNRIWLQHGRTATLVLVHGFAAESNGWRPLFNAMRQASLLPDIGVLAIDLPGHGKSPDDDAGSFERMIQAVEATLTQEQVDHFHLVAHSLGGAIAVGLTAQTGLDVRSLTLLAPAGFGESCNWAFIHGLTTDTGGATLKPWLQELVHDTSFIDDAFVATAAQQLGRAERRATLGRIAELLFRDGRQQLDMRQALAELEIPVRVVWGKEDSILPVTHADRLCGAVAQHRLTGVGHLPQVEAVKDVARIVSAQLMTQCTLQPRSQSASQFAS